MVLIFAGLPQGGSRPTGLNTIVARRFWSACPNWWFWRFFGDRFPGIVRNGPKSARNGQHVKFYIKICPRTPSNSSWAKSYSIFSENPAVRAQIWTKSLSKLHWEISQIWRKIPILRPIKKWVWWDEFQSASKSLNTTGDKSLVLDANRILRSGKSKNLKN